VVPIKMMLEVSLYLPLTTEMTPFCTTQVFFSESPNQERRRNARKQPPSPRYTSRNTAAIPTTYCTTPNIKLSTIPLV
jgi:hypothetical protein